MITLKNVSKTFTMRGVHKLVADQINISFPTDKSVALLGRNGAGKSTLLRIISGEIRPDTGTVKSTGKISWPIGFAGSFHGDLTGIQNLRFLARVYGIDSDSLLNFVSDFSELGDSLNVPVRSYSSGMRSRLAFGISMGIHFDTYLVDEVTSVGDAAFREKSSEIFKSRMQVSGAIVVSHSMATIRDLCETAAVIENGKITYYSDLEEGISIHSQNMSITNSGQVRGKKYTKVEKLEKSLDTKNHSIKLLNERAITLKSTVASLRENIKEKQSAIERLRKRIT